MKSQHVGSVVLGALLSLGACAAEPDPSAAAPSEQQRAAMAAVHEKMAACLRSDKAIEECRAEMQKACKSLGDHHCSMMDGGRMGMHHGMQPNEPKDPTSHDH